MKPVAYDLHACLEERLAEVLRDLGAARGVDLAGTALPISPPKDRALGDLGVACFALAKPLGAPPPEAARLVAERLGGDPLLAEVAVAGPFVNVRLDRAALAERTVRGVLEGRAPFGPWDANGEVVVIDFSSPNIAKPFHLGHLRSTVIGAALSRIYKHTGHEVHGVNHLGDWGAQFGKILVAWAEWGDEAALARDPMRHLFDIYVRYGKEAKERPELDERAARAFQRLETGEDNEERRTWQKLRDISLRAFQGPYDRLGVTFEHVTGESFYEDKMDAVIRTLEAAGLAVESEGALVVELEGMPPCILRKSDGTTIYATRDLAALAYRRETFGFDRALYVVGQEQKLHFRQLEAVLERLGWPEAAHVEHVDFGLILFWHEDEGKWKKGTTRGGNAIFLGEVLDEAVAKVREVIEAKNPGLAGKDAVAEAVGVSAIVFNDLKNERVKDVKFDWDRMLSFEGESGPYVQYAGARLASILRKAGRPELAAGPGAAAPDLGAVDWTALADAGEVLLVMQELGPTLRRAVDKNEPSLVTALMIRLAGSIHSYLRDHHVLNAEEPVRSARLALVAAARRLLATGLGLLGVASPDEM
ncbi:MAG: arginine--tRNA ligase [Planctomycetota bacterium]